MVCHVPSQGSGWDICLFNFQNFRRSESQKGPYYGRVDRRRKCFAAVLSGPPLSPETRADECNSVRESDSKNRSAEKEWLGRSQ
mmetsp:Transcript_27096/g.105465  ORF Transcript_27096/g.105465 Transcript_27096/m.105465 type:complete len:84 (-) Transcript_27096:174-425(-)